MSDLPAARPDGTPRLPAPLTRAAEALGGKVADTFDWLGAAGISETARRNLLATGFTTFGCGTLIVLTALIAMVGNLTAGAPKEPVAVPAPAVQQQVDPLALAPGEIYYVVQRGDTLSQIAAFNEVPMGMFEARNAPVLDEWRGECLAKAKDKPGACVKVVYPGRKLVVPVPATKDGVATTATP